jgi:cation transport ATPase
MPIEPATPDPAAAQEAYRKLLHRPRSERLREHKYRCAQAIVFGLPVVALESYGPALGGTAMEASRWIGLLQALLAGWVLYTGATGLLIEGLLQIRRGPWADLAVAVTAYLLYLWSVVVVLWSIASPAEPLRLFHGSVVLIAFWTGVRWWQYSRGG